MTRGFVIIGSVFIVLFSWTALSIGNDVVEVWGVDVIKYGIYYAQGETLEDESHSPGGRRHIVTEPEFLEQTFKIPAILGTRFGFQYIINGTPKGAPVPIQIKKTYPALRDPARDKVVEGHDYVSIHKIGSVYGTGYGFDHNWELVAGTWTFQILYADTLLGEISFEIYKPE